MLLGSLVSILSCMCSQNSLQQSLERQSRHLRKPRKNLTKLKELVEQLEARRSDLNTKLNQMWLENGMNPREEVKLWIQSVDRVKIQVSNLTENNVRGCSFNFVCSRIKFGEVVEEKMSEVKELLDKFQFLDDNSVAENLPKVGHILPASPLMECDTTMKSLTRILECLARESVKRIGVYGMGGVGKTTIMKEIHNRLLERRDFDHVIWVSTPKEPSPEKLQKGIGEKLDLDLSMINDDVTRAAKLFEALTRRRRFTLILDDLWAPFPLETIGIPIPTLENGCKLVITTRLLSVCRGMETDEDVEVKALQDDEAWDLLRHKVGPVVSNSAVEMIAKEVTKECGGLPLAIVTVGLALRNVAEVSEWECALDELRASTANIERMEEAVFEHLRFSYAKLKDDTSRSCFLFCALYPESHQIDTNELIEYWMWEGLLGYVGGIAAIKRKGKIILNELKHACLLEGMTQKSGEFVRMHDLIRDMAITIMRKNPHCISKAGTRMTKHQWIEEWAEDVQRVSLMRNDLNCIPFSCNNLICPRLTSLLLQFNSFSQNISNEFFENMRVLKVLDLSYTGIEFLPNSASDLENLSALLLSNCWNLSAVPSLEKLNKLMVLDLSCSPRMKELPNGMQNLGNLRRLNLSKTGIEIFPFGLISKFTLLEDLLIGGCGILWGSMTVKAISGGASIEEIISSNISSLELDLWNADVFDQYAKCGNWVQLEKFKITIGQPQTHFHEERSLAFSGRFVQRENPVSLPPNTLELHLDDCADIKNLSMCLVNVTQLKSCKIRWCDDIECIIDSEEEEENTLPILERMELLVLGNLKMICRDVVRPGTLMSLKIITVEYCPKLKTLFSGQVLLQLKNLEEISVRSCTGMEYIMKGEEEEEEEEEEDFMGGNDSRIEFPKLKRMKLKSMPLLRRIYAGTILCPCLRSLEVASCEALKRLPFDLSTTPALEEIKATRTWWNSLKWYQAQSKDAFLPYLVEIRLTSTSER